MHLSLRYARRALLGAATGALLLAALPGAGHADTFTLCVSQKGKILSVNSGCSQAARQITGDSDGVTGPTGSQGPAGLRDLPAIPAQLVRKVRRVPLDRRALSAQRARPETPASRDLRVRQERKDRRDSRGLREYRVYKDRREIQVIRDSSRSCWPAATWAAPCRRWIRMRGF